MPRDALGHSSFQQTAYEGIAGALDGLPPENPEISGISPSLIFYHFQRGVHGILHWIGLVGKIFTGFTMVFTIKLKKGFPVKIFPSSNSMNSSLWIMGSSNMNLVGGIPTNPSEKYGFSNGLQWLMVVNGWLL